MKLNINMPLRGAFLSLFEPQSVEGSEPKYNGKFIVEPGSKAAKQLDEAMFAVAKEKWGDKAQKIFDGLVKTGKPKNIEVCFVHEPYPNRDGDPYDGFEDMFYLSASSATRPLVIDRDKTPLVAADGRPYSGSYMNVQVEIWAQDNQYGKRINAQLLGVQFARDGDSFGAGARAADPDDFGDLSAEADDPMAD